MSFKFAATERTTTTASLQSNAMLSDHLPNGNNNDKNKENGSKSYAKPSTSYRLMSGLENARPGRPTACHGVPPRTRQRSGPESSRSCARVGRQPRPSDEILLYRIGTFFKIMHEDAKKAAGPMDLKLFVTGEASCPMPVCGFPKSGLDKYVGKLIRAGFSVAVCAQVSAENGAVRREVNEVIRCSKT